MVLQGLVESGVNAFGVSPSGSWEMDEDSVVKSDMSVIEDLLRKGFVPVLHGDCVRDRKKGFNILSGDIIVEALAGHFKPKRVVFVSDVDGVFDKPPNSPDATLLKEISLDADGMANDVEYSLPEVDVTGGMASKLTRASNIAQMNIPVFVVGSSAEEIRQACTEGKTNGKGTKIFSTSPTSPK
jgi:isopentenyl phosphate kinase